MKKIELKKETIANLSGGEMTNVQGGAQCSFLICRTKKCNETIVQTICVSCGENPDPEPVESVCAEQACSVTPSYAFSGCEGTC